MKADLDTVLFQGHKTLDPTPIEIVGPSVQRAGRLALERAQLQKSLLHDGFSCVGRRGFSILSHMHSAAYPLWKHCVVDLPCPRSERSPPKTAPIDSAIDCTEPTP